MWELNITAIWVSPYKRVRIDLNFDDDLKTY
jgi:hypothetical protein